VQWSSAIDNSSITFILYGQPERRTKGQAISHRLQS